jgi:hypothetical protein
MTTFILFLMGAFVMWRWALYLWCDHCGQNVRDTRKSRFCAKCRGQFENDLDKMLTGG